MWPTRWSAGAWAHPDGCEAIEPLLPPEGAPNVLLILLDDVGFGAASTFGGPCRTPTADRLAAGGLRYNRFHTTAKSSPMHGSRFTGKINWVQIDLGKDDHDHFIDPEERLRVAMSRQ